MEDERDNIRRECIANVDLNAKTIPFIITRCLDKSSKVRVEVYKALKQSTAVGFLDLESEDRLQIITHGLNDFEADVKDACKEYIIS